MNTPEQRLRAFMQFAAFNLRYVKLVTGPTDKPVVSVVWKTIPVAANDD